MRARKGNYDSGVDEDERVCDDDKRRALNLATTQVLATFLSILGIKQTRHISGPAVLNAAALDVNDSQPSATAH